LRFFHFFSLTCAEKSGIMAFLFDKGDSRMAFQIYIFSLMTALMWGIMQVFYKRGLAAGGNPLQSSLTVVGVNLLIFCVLLLVVPENGTRFEHLSLRATCIFAVGGLLGTALGRFINAVGIDQVGATVNSAASSSRPLFTAAIAMLWLGESGEPLLYVGIVLLVLGVVILTFSKGGDIRGWRPTALWIPLAGAAVLALGNVIRRFGLTTTSITVIEALTINQAAAFAALLAYALAAGGRDVLRAPRATYFFFLLAGIFGAAALLTLFEALNGGPVTIVDPLVGTQPLFTTLLAYFLLGDLERITLSLVVGTILVVIGATMIMVSDVTVVLR
jgi:drug/metabolite transporter, DME family